MAEVAERLNYIARRENKPVGQIDEHDAFHYEHQMPGGMVSNLKSQLATLGIAHRLPEVLEESARVRCELGYPIIVSPFAQFVMTQAVLNVMGKERYGMHWPGKADCFKTIQMPSLGTLRPCPEESVNFDTTENLIIEGDNLEVLKLLQKSYLGKVKMIYIDPPYNTGNDFIYPDDYSESLQT